MFTAAGLQTRPLRLHALSEVGDRLLNYEVGWREGSGSQDRYDNVMYHGHSGGYVGGAVRSCLRWPWPADTHISCPHRATFADFICTHLQQPGSLPGPGDVFLGVFQASQ